MPSLSYILDILVDAWQVDFTENSGRFWLRLSI